MTDTVSFLSYSVCCCFIYRCGYSFGSISPRISFHRLLACRILSHRFGIGAHPIVCLNSLCLLRGREWQWVLNSLHLFSFPIEKNTVSCHSDAFLGREFRLEPNSELNVF